MVIKTVKEATARRTERDNNRKAGILQVLQCRHRDFQITILDNCMQMRYDDAKGQMDIKIRRHQWVKRS